MKIERTALRNPPESDGSPIGSGCFGVVYHKIMQMQVRSVCLSILSVCLSVYLVCLSVYVSVYPCSTTLMHTLK